MLGNRKENVQHHLLVAGAVSAQRSVSTGLQDWQQGFTVCVNGKRKEQRKEFLRSDCKRFHAAQATQKLAGRQEDGFRERKSSTHATAARVPRWAAWSSPALLGCPSKLFPREGQVTHLITDLITDLLSSTDEIWRRFPPSSLLPTFFPTPSLLLTYIPGEYIDF